MKLKIYLRVVFMVMASLLLLRSSALTDIKIDVGVMTDTTYSMDFESIPDFSLTFGNWTVNDVDQHATYGIIGHTFPHQMEAMAFISFNPASVVPSMASDQNIQPHGGQRFGACFSANPPSNNDWFISPQIQLGENGVFSFWVKSYSDLYGLDRYRVMVSTTGNDPASFSTISGPDSLQTSLTWTRKSFSLADFNNQKVYVAIRCVSNDNFLMMIDDLEIRTQSSDTIAAGFMADKTSAHVGENVNFTDQSTGLPTAWSWAFPGATPAISALQNPVNIKYNSPGSYPVTLIASNGVNGDTLTKEGYITVTGYPSNLTLDFESLEDFTLVFEPWTTIDVSGGTTYGINGISFPHQFAPMAFICFNPANTSPSLTTMAAHSGEKLGCSFSSEPPYNPNDKWLITPKMTLGYDPQITFWVQTYNPEYGEERYNVLVSTTDMNPASFVSLTAVPESAPTIWTQKSYSLSGYVNQTVYVAIQCVTDDSFIFMIDDISITSAVGIGEYNTSPGLIIFPNPAKEKITLNFIDKKTAPFSVELINSSGATIRSWNETGSNSSFTFPIHGVSPGIYIVRLREEHSESFYKITIVN